MQGKKVTQHSYRGRWRSQLAGLGRATDTEEVDAATVSDWKPRRVTLQGPTTTLFTRVVVSVTRRLIARIESFRSEPYDPARHRAPLVAGLAALPRLTGLPHSRLGAVPWRAVESLNALLSPPIYTPLHRLWHRLPVQEARGAEPRRIWFAAFCRDQPAWERHLRSWVQQASRLDG